MHQKTNRSFFHSNKRDFLKDYFYREIIKGICKNQMYNIRNK